MGRDAPLVVNVFVAGSAFAGRGVSVFGEELQVRIDRVAIGGVEIGGVAIGGVATDVAGSLCGDFSGAVSD
jgi:hypothetical protein